MKRVVNNKERNYWIKLLKEYEEPTNFDVKYATKLNQEYKTKTFKIPQDISDKLNRICNNSELPVYVFMLSISGILISKYSNNKKICIVSPIYMRNKKEDNNIVLPIELHDNMNFKELLMNVKNTLFQCYQKDSYPINEVIKDLGKESIFDISDIGCALSNIHKTDSLENLGLSIIFDFSKEESYIKCNIKYRIKDDNFIESLFNQFLSCLINILSNIDSNINEIEIIGEFEKNMIINKFNDTKREYPRENSVKELFEEVVKKLPNKTAIICDEISITYDELNMKANQLAKLLIKQGISKESLVPVLCDRSIETILSMIAITKIGAAYVPINEDYPESRVKYMIKDSNGKIIIGKKKNLCKFGFDEMDLNIINIENCDMSKEITDNIPSNNYANDLIYVIYTSGSTGNPKGVCVENRGVVRLVKNQNYIELNEKGTMLQTCSMAFDVSVGEIWGSLLNGLTMHIGKKEVLLNPKKLKEYIEKNNITIMFMATALFHQICNIDVSTFDCVKSLLVAGEALNTNQFNKFRENNKWTKLINGYGPTENSTLSTSFLLDQNKKWDKEYTLPIGKPILNSTAYVMDRNLKLLPVGVPGELCVGGDGVARGYLNNIELTKEKFIDNPYVKGEKIYKTGDRAKWLPDGNIEFLGRIDNQVKIRGFRIELGEIEKEILNNKKVKEAIVIVRNDKNKEKYLCGYVVGNVNQGELKEFIKKTLPEYMVPSYIIKLESMPLTTNGKIDKKLLPEPNYSEMNTEYIAPRNNTEKIMVNIWEEILDIGKISIKENFYDMGGDSIKAIQIVSRLKSKGIKIDIKDILENKTIEATSKYVKKEKTNISQEEVIGQAMLTPVMKKFNQVDKNAISHFNQSMLIFSEKGFEKEKVILVLKKILSHHDALRIVFNFEEKILYNHGTDVELVDVQLYDLFESEDIEKIIEYEGEILKQSINLDKGPLIKTGLFKTNKGDYLLLIIHHLVVDGVSWRIILEDFYNGYKALLEGKEINFPKKTTSFKEWTEKQVKYANSKVILNELDYWSKVSEESLDILPKSIDTDKILIKDMISKRLTIDKEATRKLVINTNRAYNTEINDILLSALGLSVKEWCGAKKIAITLEGHGREDIIEGVDITRTVGWFTSCYPVILDMRDSDIGTSIKRNKEILRRVPNKGINYGILKYLTDDTQKQNKMIDVKTDISFNYLGQVDSDSNNDLFVNSNIYTGRDINYNFQLSDSIQINSLIQEGILKFNIDFCKKEYDEEEMQRFVGIFEKNIIEVIEHCSSRQQIEYTPTDYGINEYSLEDIKELKEFICNNIDSNMRISKVNKLVPMQKGMFFTYLKNKETTAYVVQLEMNIVGDLNIESLNKAYDMLASKYDILRTVIYNNSKHPSQVILDNRTFNIDYKDFSNKDNKEEMYELFSNNLIKNGFDLSRDSLFKISALKMNDDYHRLIFTVHHIIVDGWSIGILISDFFKMYEASEKKEHINIQKSNNYQEYIKWIYSQDKDEALEHWREYLSGYNQVVELPKIKSKTSEYKQEVLTKNFDVEITRKLEKISRTCGVTLNTICQLAWGILQQRYINNNDVVFGAVVSGRPPEIDGIEEIVGIFINAVPVRITDNGDLTIKQMLQQIHKKAGLSRNFEYLSLAEIQEQSQLKENLIQNLMVFENFPLNQRNNEEDSLKIEFLKGREETNYNLNLSFVLEDTLKLKIMYNSNVYDNYMIEKMSRQLYKIFDCITKDSEQLVSSIDIVTEEEKRTILNDFNNTKVEYPSFKTIHELFEKQVKKTPNNIALTFEGKNLTYKELNERSNALARTLKEKGVRTETIVGIMIDRSIEMIVGILGILKAGGAYLPIDSKLPTDRINYMLNDCSIDILLSQSNLIDRVKKECEIIDITKKGAYSNNYESINSTSKSDNLAYVIYTSGTTGIPKGTLIEHRNILNTLKWRCDYHNFNKNDVVLQIMSYSFDGSVGDIFTALISGSRLVLVNQNELLNVEYLKETMIKEGVTSLLISPAFYGTLLENGLSGVSTLKKVTVAGESLQNKVLKNHFNRFPQINLVNEYGPTENSICTTAYKLTNYTDKILIGKPINNTRIYILGKNNDIKTIGAQGELCISGNGLARGYLNNEKITSERFIDNPYEPENRMYKTGDLARWLPDGNIEFLGRIDNQVKIRGFRIELEEIEYNLLKLDGVKQAVASIIDEDGNKYICIHFVSVKEYKPKDIREHLKMKIPEYMMPTYFVKVKNIPLNINGKVDKNKLKKPEKEDSVKCQYEPPKTNTEIELANIWRTILKTHKIGANDNFFELGGQSLKAINLVSHLKAINFDVNINDVFSYQTLRELAVTLDERRQNKLLNTPIEVETLLLEALNIESKLKIKTFNNKKLSILYVANLKSEMHEKIINVLKDSVNSEIFPNYIFDKSVYMDIFNSRNEYKNYDALLCECMEKFRRSFDDFETERCNLTTIQKLSINKNIEAHSLCMLSFEKYVDVDTLKKAILYTIKTFDNLQKIIVKEKEYVYWNKFKNLHCIDNIYIPFIDLSKESIDDQEQILKNLLYNCFIEKYDFNNILYRIVIIKKNLKDYIVYIPINHCIFDGTSNLILKNTINKYYNDLSNNEEIILKQVKTYGEYNNQISKGPVNISEEEIIKVYQLEKFNKYSEIIQGALNNTKYDYGLVRAKLPISKEYNEVFKKDSWKVICKIIQKFCKKYIGVSQIPLEVITYGRTYEDKNFNDVLGECIDRIPMIIDSEENSAINYKCCKNLTEHASQHNINFVTLINDCSISGKYKKIDNLMKSFGDDKNRYNIVLNFLGNIDNENIQTHDDIRTLMDKYNKENKDRKTIGFSISYSNDYLYLTCYTLLFEKNIQKFLLKTLNDIEKQEV